MKKVLVRLASLLFPNRVVKFAFDQLSNPQVRKLRAHEVAVLEKSTKETLAFKTHSIQCYRWGDGAERVLLVHGWEGQAGNFSDFIAPLLSKGYTVYAFDAPSHGYSSRGNTNLFEFTELVGLMIQKYRVTKLISHSFGGVAVTYALYENRDLSLKKYVLLTVPDKFSQRIDDVCEQIGITPKVKAKLIQHIGDQTQLDLTTTNVSFFVKNINVDHALIIHDKNDKVIPIERSKNVHHQWANSEFQEITDTGHFRILRTPAVVDRTINFLNTTASNTNC